MVSTTARHFPPNMSQTNPVDAIEIHCNIILQLQPRFFESSLSLRFPHKDPLLSLILATCPAHHILVDLITPIIFGENQV
jgi:PIN domain nuclease of toxin-antitoxin system